MNGESTECPGARCALVWRELSKASFAAISWVTPRGEPRSSGVVYGEARRHLFVAVAPDSLKARQIGDGGCVSMTVPVRRGGLLALLFPIPPATISFQARVVVHPSGSLDPASVSPRFARLLPESGRDRATIIELVPVGAFLTYGVGVSLKDLANPAKAAGHVPVDAELAGAELAVATEPAERR